MTDDFQEATGSDPVWAGLDASNDLMEIALQRGIDNADGFVGILPSDALSGRGFRAVIANVQRGVPNVVSVVVNDRSACMEHSFYLALSDRVFFVWLGGHRVFSIQELDDRIVPVTILASFKMTFFIGRDRRRVEHMMRLHADGGPTLMIHECFEPASTF